MSIKMLVLSFVLAVTCGVVQAAETVDRAYLSDFALSNSPCCGVALSAFPDAFELSGGSGFTVLSAAYPSIGNGFAKPRVTKIGRWLIYTFVSGGAPWLQYGYYGTAGHSTSVVLMQPKRFVLIAVAGSSKGVVRGFSRMTANDPLPANPDTGSTPENFNYNSAPVGESVYVELQVNLQDARFAPDLFDTNFNYSVSGLIDFTRSH